MTSLRPKLALTLAVVVAGAIAAPAAAQDEPSPSIEGPVWELLTIGEAAADVSASMSLDDGTAAIFGGCNSFFGSYALDGQSLTFDQDFTSTLVECEPDVMDQESAYISALGDVASYEVQDDILDLSDDGGGQVLSFEETSVATTTDIAALEIALAKTEARLHHVNERLHRIDARDDVKALEAHVNELTRQHTSLRDRLHEHRQRIHSLETELAIVHQALVMEGIMTIDDSE